MVNTLLNKYQQAEQIADYLKKNPDLLNEAQKIVAQIRELHRLINLTSKLYQQDQQCATCPECCCVSEAENYIQVGDFLSFILSVNETIREQFLAILKNANPERKNCCLLEEGKGCIIPLDTRPFVCKTEFCSNNVLMRMADRWKMQFAYLYEGIQQLLK